MRYGGQRRERENGKVSEDREKDRMPDEQGKQEWGEGAMVVDDDEGSS